MKKSFWWLSVLLFACGCASETNGGEVEIPFSKMESLEYGDFPGGVFSAMDFVVLDTEEGKCFSQIEKAVYRGGNLYIMDWVFRKIFTFDADGHAVAVLSKKGNGPGEYLQISDFDVAENGNIWVLDGQKKQLLEYGADGVLSSRKPGYDIDNLHCLVNNQFLFRLASWDSSEYAGKELLIADAELNVQNAFVDYGEFVDENFQLPAIGMADDGTDIFYHQPIDDYVYRINLEGGIDSVYYFNFGSRTVPDDARKDIERYLDDFSGYTALAKASCVMPDFVIGGLFDSSALKDFILDRHTGRVYIQNDAYNCFALVGVSGGKAIYWVVPGCEELPADFPAQYKADYEAGHEILALLDLDKLSLMFK